MKFTKMHGLGNDYIYIYTEEEKPWDKLSVELSHRHFGIGSDGIITISPSPIADFKMRIFNADGSEAKMCGNGIRCVGKYVYDYGYTDKTHLKIDTLSGIKTLHLTPENGKIVYVSVEMGKALISEKKLLDTSFGKIEITPVSMGNPHGVIFTEDAENAPLDTLGKELEHHSNFPDGVNVEFISLISENKIRMRVWERGSGITMACGTGSCAAAATAVFYGLCRKNTEIEVVLDGGSLFITVDDEYNIIMKGPAVAVYEGQTL